MNEKEENIIKISMDIQKNSDINYIIKVFEIMKDSRYSDWTLEDFKDFLIELINK